MGFEDRRSGNRLPIGRFISTYPMVVAYQLIRGYQRLLRSCWLLNIHCLQHIHLPLHCIFICRDVPSSRAIEVSKCVDCYRLSIGPFTFTGRYVCNVACMQRCHVHQKSCSGFVSM